MSQAEQAIIKHEEGAFIDKWCKRAFINVLKKLPQGCMTLKENGVMVAQFGDMNSELQAEVNILDKKAYRHLLFGGSVASGETYMDGMWNTPNLTNVIRIFARNLPTLDKWEKRFAWLTFPINKIQHFFNRNSVAQARKNIQAHYDLGNQLYTHFLDESMMYSAAVYPHQKPI